MNEKNKLNNNFLKYFFLFSFLLLIINITVRFFLPKEVPIQTSDFQTTNKDGSQSIFLEVTSIIDESNKNVPDSFSIATYENKDVNFDAIKNSLITTLNLSVHPSVETIWSNDDWYLNYQPETNKYILLSLENNDHLTEVNLPTGFNIDDLTTFVENEKSKFLPNLNIGVQVDEIEYWLDDHEFVEQTTIEKATFANVPLTYTIGGYPIFYKKEAIFPFYLTVFSDLSFGKLTYYPFETTPNIIGEKNSLSIDQAIENIRTNKFASIISNVQERGTELKIDTILSVNFETYSIEYRVDEEQGLIYPFYRFSGNAETTNDNLWVEVLTPAVDITL
jgi:hypothetical protein